MSVRKILSKEVFLGLFFLSCNALHAQDAQTALFLDLAPQHTRLNVSSRPAAGYFGMPLLSNFRMEMGNSMLHPASWLFTVPGASESSLDLNAVRESFRARNDLSVNLQWDWLSLGGFSANRKSFWSIAVSEHIQSNLELPSDLLLLPFTGNGDATLLESDGLDFSSLSFRSSHRREYAGTWQFQWNEMVSSGVRLAYLQGLSFAGTRDNTTQWAVDPDSYTWTVQGGIGMDVAGLPIADAANSSELTNYLNTKGNRGVSADLAFELNPSERWSCFVQIADIGRVHWQTGAENWNISDTTMVFSGLSIDGIESADSWPTDSLENWLMGTGEDWVDAFEIDTTYTGFTEKLMPKLSIGLSWEVLNASHHLGTVGAWGRSNGSGLFDWRLSYNHKINERLAVSLSHGALQSRKSTWGLAVCMNAGPLAVFVATDHIGLTQLTRIVVDRNSNETGNTQDVFVVPNQAHTMQIQAGLTWRLGWRKKKGVTSINEGKLDQSNFLSGSSRSPDIHNEDHPGAVPCSAPGSWKD